MSFTQPLPVWNAPGVEPPSDKKNAGWLPNEKPPADYWNWQMHLTFKALEELQQKALESSELGAVLGTANTDVVEVKGVLLETDTRSVVLTYTSGLVTKAEEKSGSTVVKTTQYNYDSSSGRLLSVTETAGGKTVAIILNYDGNGALTGYSKGVT
ncbi:hypothetical protein SAMN02799624_04550 [Paenibacillus sp. UNC496MF]|uniref:hypothetical protein n=1 Tax=Paenibacillus sp. UNC496MF TaxID=1502753 RepID=UPI0008EF25FE|nr:hypothetical protein [Paenibacillus sp. UNC496MF]SFJ44519.1 hypothetical protein SAMN02799624_04550 [Paenibacillus sp. UNC496MF]